MRYPALRQTLLLRAGDFANLQRMVYIQTGALLKTNRFTLP